MRFSKLKFTYYVAALCLSVILSACGFQLRGMNGEELAFESITVISTNKRSEFVQALNGALDERQIDRSLGSKAEYTIDLMRERLNRRPVATSANISVSEYELVLSIQIRVKAKNGKIIMPLQGLSAERIYNFDNTSLTGNSEEERLLSLEMRHDLIDQIFRRLNAALKNNSPT